MVGIESKLTSLQITGPIPSASDSLPVWLFWQLVMGKRRQGWVLGRNEVIHFHSLPIRALPTWFCFVTIKPGEFEENFYLVQSSLSSGAFLTQTVHCS